ncbi:MAG: PE domain-containing protein [Mycobacterium sp.]
MVLNVDPATVGASAATEEGISAAIAASSSAAAAALTTVMPMGADLDSAAFAAALNAAGASYVGAAGEHFANRSEFAGAQTLAAATYTATEAIRDTALSL